MVASSRHNAVAMLRYHQPLEVELVFTCVRSWCVRIQQYCSITVVGQTNSTTADLTQRTRNSRSGTTR